jgi:hypothetical protein
MEDRKLAAWKNVRNAGTVSLVAGWLSVAGGIIFFILGLIFAIANFSIPSDSGGEPLPSIVLGIIIIFASLLVLIFAVLYIVAGMKLRKPVANPRGWVIFTVVMGALGLSSIIGILMLIFGILALTSLHEIEGAKPPENL